jgi:hypothetical protein
MYHERELEVDIVERKLAAYKADLGETRALERRTDLLRRMSLD